VITAEPMRSRRGPERRLVQPGQLLAWDPSHAHAGSAADGKPWSARLMVVEIPGLDALAGDEETAPLVNVAFPEPVLSEPDLVRDFLSLHRALDSPGTRLERDDLLAEWLRSLVERFSTAQCPPSTFTHRDDRALRLACDYLAAGRNATSDSTSSPSPPASASSASSDCSGSGPVSRRTRCTSHTGSGSPGAYSRPATPSLTPPPPRGSPTNHTCTATFSAASA
jgi:hypothetical protein